MKVALTLVGALSLALSACVGVPEPPPQADTAHLIAYANYCAVPYVGPLSARSVTQSGFAGVEQQCGVFFDKLAELSQSGRFVGRALDATSLGTQTIMQAAKAAATSVTIVGAGYTLTEAVLNAFEEQYAFSPYLYKIKELTFQALNKHHTDAQADIDDLRDKASADDYCTAAIMIQQHASICTISSIQSLFDQQVANTTKVVPPDDKAADQARGKVTGPVPLHTAFMTSARVRARASFRAPASAASAVSARPRAPLLAPNFPVEWVAQSRRGALRVRRMIRHATIRAVAPGRFAPAASARALGLLSRP